MHRPYQVRPGKRLPSSLPILVRFRRRVRQGQVRHPEVSPSPFFPPYLLGCLCTDYVPSLLTLFDIHLSLVDHKLTFSNLLVELPINIANSTLVNAFLATLSLPPLALSSPSSSTTTAPFSPSSLPLLPPNHNPLSLLLPSSLTTSLESTSRALDDYRREADSLSFNARDIARQKVKLDALLGPGSGVGEDEARRMVRVPAEASRLNSLLLLAQVDEFAKGMAGAAGGGVARMFAGQV
jgi:translation initiation factor 3 subunit H